MDCPDSFWAGVLQSRVDVTRVKSIQLGHKHLGLLRGFHARYGGSLKKAHNRYLLVYKGELKNALMHALKPFLDGKVDEKEWVRGYVAGGGHIGKRDLRLKRRQGTDIIQRIKTVLGTALPTVVVRGTDEGIAVYRSEDREKVLRWVSVGIDMSNLKNDDDDEEEDGGEVNVQLENARAMDSTLRMVNTYRYHTGVGQKYPSLSKMKEENLIFDLQRTHPVLEYKYLSSKYGYSPAQIAYLVQKQRKIGTVFPVRRGQGVTDPNIVDYIQNQYHKILLNPRNEAKKNFPYASIIRDKVQREFQINVHISMVRHIVKEANEDTMYI